MNPERYITRKQEEATRINDAVDEYYDAHPRTKKSAGELADEIIKKDAAPIPYRAIPEEQQDWHRNMNAAGVRALQDGFLEVTRWDNTGQYVEKPKKLKQTVADLPAAIRMQDHILNNYRGETTERQSESAKLESIQEVIQYANHLLNEWKVADTETKQELQTELADVVLQLEKCRNEFKIEVRAQAKAVLPLTDSRGRENPSALAARTIGALNNLTERITQMRLIAPQIALRKEVLILEQRRLEKTLRRTDSLLSGVLHHSVFSERSNSLPERRIRDNEVAILETKLGQALHELESVYAAPYQQIATQARFFISRIKKLFHSKDSIINNREVIIETLADVQEILRTNPKNFK